MTVALKNPGSRGTEFLVHVCILVVEWGAWYITGAHASSWIEGINPKVVSLFPWRCSTRHWLSLCSSVIGILAQVRLDYLVLWERNEWLNRKRLLGPLSLRKFVDAYKGRDWRGGITGPPSIGFATLEKQSLLSLIFPVSESEAVIIALPASCACLEHVCS